MCVRCVLAALGIESPDCRSVGSVWEAPALSCSPADPARTHPDSYPLPPPHGPSGLRGEPEGDQAPAPVPAKNLTFRVEMGVRASN